MSLRLSIVFMLLSLSGTTFGLDLEIYRNWTSVDGRSIRAKVISVDSSSRTALFQRDDGRQFTISFDQLEEADAQSLDPKHEPKAAAPAPNDSPFVFTVAEPDSLPKRVELDDVPMVVQKNNYCVPASAAMIAQYHGIDTDQDQIAQLSSAASENNLGTYPRDMLLAMEKLGFTGKQLIWKNSQQYDEKALNRIRRFLHESGPVYVSYRAGIFGNMGHGCVIVGYNDRKKEFTIHNPWGNVFTEQYGSLATDGYGVVLIDPPVDAPVADDAFIEYVRAAIPAFDRTVLTLQRRLESAGVSNELIWCSRADSRRDPKFARETARDHGRQILELSFERNPAVIITENEKETTVAHLFVTRPDQGARFVVRRIDASGWSEPSYWTLGQLTRGWPTQFKDNEGLPIWELPMIELHPDR